MPKDETPLRALRTWKQYEKLNHEIEAKVRKLVNHEDAAARDLAYLVRLIFNEPTKSEQEIIVNKILECAFVNSEAFWTSRDEWMNENAPEHPVRVRKRA